MKNFNNYIKQRIKMPERYKHNLTSIVDQEQQQKLDDLLAVLAKKNQKILKAKKPVVESINNSIEVIDDKVRQENLLELIQGMSCFDDKLRLKFLLSQEMVQQQEKQNLDQDYIDPSLEQYQLKLKSIMAKQENIVIPKSHGHDDIKLVEEEQAWESEDFKKVMDALRIMM